MPTCVEIPDGLKGFVVMSVKRPAIADVRADNGSASHMQSCIEKLNVAFFSKTVVWHGAERDFEYVWGYVRKQIDQLESEYMSEPCAVSHWWVTSVGACVFHYFVTMEKHVRAGERYWDLGSADRECLEEAFRDARSVLIGYGCALDYVTGRAR